MPEIPRRRRGVQWSPRQLGLFATVLVALLVALPAALAIAPQRANDAGVSASAALRCDRYASPRGRDSARGSARRPFRTVHRLLRSLRPGWVGCLGRGTWSEDVGVARGGRQGAPIVLTHAPGARPTVRGIFSVSRTAHDVIIRGLRLDGANSDATPSPQVNAERITFAGNNVTNRHSGICFVAGGEFEHYGIARDLRLIGNRIHDCGRLPATGHDHGIYLEGTERAVVKGNLIYGNADWGVHFYPAAEDSLVEGNVIDGNGGGVIFAGEAGYASSGNLVAHNVISRSTRTYNVESWWGDAVGSGNLATNNCLWGGAEGDIAETLGFDAVANVLAEPRFVDAEGRDRRVRAGTECARIVGDPGESAGIIAPSD